MKPSTLLCKAGWTFRHTCPSLSERDGKTYLENFLPVPWVSRVGVEKKC
jgi:hypothetical protein